MKKITLLICLLLSVGSVFAQTDYYTVLPNNGGTSQNGRAPQGARGCSRSVWIITAAEMAASGFTTGSVVTSLGFNYSVAQNTATTGTIVIYLQNTADNTNLKSTSWNTAITGMTTVSNGAVTIPAAAGTFDIPFSGGSAFTYTGGSLYVAFDYQNFANPVSTLPNTALCNTSIVGGLKGVLSAAGATTPPGTIAASDYRPQTRLGKQVACAMPQNLTEVVASKTTTSITVSWTNATNTSIEYGPVGFTPSVGTTPGNGTVVNNVTSPYTITNLSPSSIYDIYIRNNCGTVGSPTWSASGTGNTFHTVFEPTTVPYNTGFEQADLSYVGWDRTTAAPANDWFINFGGPGSPLAQEGESAAAVITPAAAAANNWMFSRGINLQGGSLAEITYYVRNFTGTGSTNTASYQLTVGQGQTAAAQTTVLATETGLSNTTFDLKTYTFTPATDGIYNFGFLHNSPANATGVHALLVDNFTVTQVLSNQEFSESTISVYPNPAKNLVSVVNTGTGILQNIRITDLNGRVVKTIERLNVAETQIDIANLNTGIYFMEIQSDQGKVIKKIIKE